MKKNRFLALLLAMTMAFSVTAFARFDDESYPYRKTTNLEANIIGEQVIVTWPAVNKAGELINANPLASNSAYGNPTAGWTTPIKGMVINYPNWLIDGTHTGNPTQVNTGDAQVLYGLTNDKTTAYPVAIKDPKTSEIIGSAYLSDEVVSENFATAYKVFYSKDNVNWTLDHTTSTINHGKKITRQQADGTFKDDAKNTFFLEDQITDPMTASLEPNTQYYLKVQATSAADLNANYKEFTTTITTPAAAEKAPAFPTVEGSGANTQGGRGTASKPGDVYVVTNLTDSVSSPQPGSLRYGLLRKDRSDANTAYPRTIVFAVGGTINVDPTASKGNRRISIGDNTTILGQTAPGEGITLAGMSTKFSGENIIARYLRVRLGDGYDQDAATVTGKNIVIDHCTFNWGVDECFTAKEIINSSIQYNIIADSLSVVNKNGVNNTDPELASGESEAKHGMGSILNGYDTSYTHNLWANHGTRNPRFEGSFTYGGITYQNKIDFSNNVFFNWGHNSGYGGDRGNGLTNMVGNYYQPGPNTLEKVYTQIYDCDGGGSTNTSSYYFTGNKMTSSPEVTANNALGYRDIGSCGLQLSSPVELTIPYVAEGADSAYSNVIASVGASYRRDSVDAKIINELRTGESTFINSQVEEGGWQTPEAVSTELDSDNDGMPDTWEDSMGLNKNDASDATMLVNDATKSYNGYSNIEVYANSLLGEWTEFNVNGSIANSTNIQIDSINNGIDNIYVKSNGDVGATVEAGKEYGLYYSYTTDTDYDGSQYELYINDKKVATNNYTFTAPTEIGNYKLAIKATGKGNTLSQPVNLAVVPAESLNKNLEGFVSTDIGSVRAAGQDSYDMANGVLVSQGAGHIGILNTSSTQNPDIFHYNYTPVSGDIEMTAKIDNLAKIDYNQLSGLMVRKTLDPSSEFYMTALTFLKGEDYEGVKDISGESVKARNLRSVYRTADGNGVNYGKMLSIPQKRVNETPNSGYIRLTVIGGEVTLYASYDNTNWYELNKFTSNITGNYYIGFATDAAQDLMNGTRYNSSKFSEITVKTPVAPLVGDANEDGTVTAEDSALALQYVLKAAGIGVQGLANTKAVIPSEGDISSIHSAMILQHVLDNSYTLPQA